MLIIVNPGTLVGKYDFQAGMYRPAMLEHPAVLVSDDMDQLTVCPGCEKNVRFGDSYTSIMWHTETGMGFAVCASCYQKEWAERRKYKGPSSEFVIS